MIVTLGFIRHTTSDVEKTRLRGTLFGARFGLLVVVGLFEELVDKGRLARAATAEHLDGKGVWKHSVLGMG